MFPRRRSATLAAIAVAAWLLCVILWAVRPLSDSVPVGVDYALSPPMAVSVTVRCNTLFASAARDASSMPKLKPQPATAPPLAFQRTPCSLPHRQARVVFALDILGVIAALGLAVWLHKLRPEQDRRRALARSAVAA